MKHFPSVLALRRTPILLIINLTQISALEDPFLVRMSFLDLRNMARLTLNIQWHCLLETAWRCSQAWERVLLLSKFGDVKFVDHFDCVSWCISFVDHSDHVARASCYFWYIDLAEAEFRFVSVWGGVFLWCKYDTSLAHSALMWCIWWFSGARSDKFLLLYWTTYLTWTLVDYIW